MTRKKWVRGDWSRVSLIKQTLLGLQIYFCVQQSKHILRKQLWRIHHNPSEQCLLILQLRLTIVLHFAFISFKFHSLKDERRYALLQLEEEQWRYLPLLHIFLCLFLFEQNFILFHLIFEKILSLHFQSFNCWFSLIHERRSWWASNSKDLKLKQVY